MVQVLRVLAHPAHEIGSSDPDNSSPLFVGESRGLPLNSGCLVFII